MMKYATRLHPQSQIRKSRLRPPRDSVSSVSISVPLTAYSLLCPFFALGACGSSHRSRPSRISLLCVPGTLHRPHLSAGEWSMGFGEMVRVDELRGTARNLGGGRFGERGSRGMGVEVGGISLALTTLNCFSSATSGQRLHRHVLSGWEWLGVRSVG